jgi:hypothetical protein
MKIIDITNPSSMQIVSTIGSGYNSIDIYNNLVFLGKESGGIDVFNISNPTTPSLAYGITNSGGTAWDLKYSNNLIYLATDNSGLFIYKLTDTSGIEMANFPNTNNGQSFAVSIQDSLILLSGLVNGVAILKYDSLGTSVGINNRISSTETNLFPNPAENYFTIESLQKSTINILNMQGQTILQQQIQQGKTDIDISRLAKGVYVLRLRCNEKTEVTKIVKE